MPRPHALSVLICATLLSGQSANLVQNGDFEGGKTTGWSFAGYTIAASVMSFDTTGVGASKGFSNRPGCKASPCKTEYTMQQSVMVIAKVPYLLTADLAVINTSVLSNVDAGKISFRVDGVLLKTVGFGTSVAQTTRRHRICINFRPGSTGSKLLTIGFSRQWVANRFTPRHHIDNIRLLRAPTLPILCPRKERKVGTGALRLDTLGTPNANFGVFVALTPRTPGIPIPGFVGAWSLGPGDLLLLTGTFSAAGTHTINFPLKNAVGAAGIKVYWQGLQLGTPSNSLGPLEMFGVYR